MGEIDSTNFMERFRAWEGAEVGHAAGALMTDTLEKIAGFLPPRLANTAETGCGKSTILFSNISDYHTAFTFDDTAWSDNSSLAFFKNCPLSRQDKVSLVLGPTQLTLKHFTAHRPYDCVFLDGPHGWPFPEFEYLMFYPHIKQGGLLLVDDLNIPTIGRMADILAEDEMWDLVDIVGATGVFRRTDAPTLDPTADGWFQQRYNRRRVSPARDIFLASDNLADRVSSLKLDRKMQG